MSIFSNGNAQLLADDLCVGRLVALAVIVRADEDRYLPGRVYPHGRAFVEAAACAEAPGDPRWCQAAGFDVSAKADPAQLTVIR